MTSQHQLQRVGVEYGVLEWTRMLKTISSFALNNIVFRAEWQDEQGRNVWCNVSFTGISGDNTLYFRVRGLVVGAR